MHFSEKRKGVFWTIHLGKDTVPTSYQINCGGVRDSYTVKYFKRFCIFQGWMGYLTFGKYGTGSWASEDGTIQCIEGYLNDF